jgi:hypothetical protein
MDFSVLPHFKGQMDKNALIMAESSCNDVLVSGMWDAYKKRILTAW